MFREIDNNTFFVYFCTLTFSFAGLAIDPGITKDNVSDEFSYSRIDEGAVRERAQEILKSEILITAAKKYHRSTIAYESLRSRIIDNWRYVSTMISWFKDKDWLSKSFSSIGILDYPIWRPWTLDEHFAQTFQLKSDHKVSAERHNLIAHNFTREEFEQKMNELDEFFAQSNNIKLLHDLQIEGLALNLIYKGIHQQKSKPMRVNNPQCFSDINLKAVTMDFIQTYIEWSRFPDCA